MTNLSFKTQKIVDVFDFEYYHNAKNRFDALASVFRALVDNVAPEDYASFTGNTEWDNGCEARNDTIREVILSIVTELEQI